MATVQLRNPTEGRAYFDRKKAAGKTSMEAMRALKRRLSDLVYRQLLADALTPSATGPGGHPGTTLPSSAADSHPDIDTSDQSPLSLRVDKSVDSPTPSTPSARILGRA